MTIIEIIRQKIKTSYNYVFDFLKAKKNEVILLRSNNYYVAMTFFGTGEITECIRRLKISLKLWPEDETFKYLLGLSYIIYRDCEKASMVLKTIKEYKMDIVSKLILLADNNKSKKIIDLYIDTNFNIVLMEDEIKNMDI